MTRTEFFSTQRGEVMDGKRLPVPVPWERDGHDLQVEPDCRHHVGPTSWKLDLLLVVLPYVISKKQRNLT